MQVPVSYSKTLAVIDENHCIGCTLCIKACPFDAIIGASKHLHTVVQSYCTGCKLCIEPCPVDCITMQENPAATQLKPEKPDFASHQACIHCNECVTVCPAHIKPDFLYSLIAKQKLHSAQHNAVESCTLCGKCDNACPSKIPLTYSFSYAIETLKLKKNRKNFTIGCKQRRESRDRRINQQKRKQQAQLSSNKLNLAAKIEALKNASSG